MPRLSPTTPLSNLSREGFVNIQVIKDDSNMDHSAQEMGGYFNDHKFRNLIGRNAHITSFLVENDFEARTHKRRNLQQSLGYDVRTKRLERIGKKFKGNVDVEISLELQALTLQPKNIDLVCLLSGDGDFAPAIQLVQDCGIPVWVMAFPHSLSHHLRRQADRCISVGQDLLIPFSKPLEKERKVTMSNLKRLSTFCNRGWNHFQPVSMQFSHFASPFTPVYRCSVCGKTKVFHRKHRGGAISRVA